jgi:hypothetical protein
MLLFSSIKRSFVAPTTYFFLLRTLTVSFALSAYSWFPYP